MKIWKIGDTSYSSVEIDSLQYIEFIPGTKSILCVTGLENYKPYTFNTIDLPQAKIINSLLLRSPEIIRLEIIDSSMYLRNRTFEESMGIFNLFTSNVENHKPEKPWSKYAVSRDKKWIAYSYPEINSYIDFTSRFTEYRRQIIRIAHFSNPKYYIEYPFFEGVDDFFFSPDGQYLYIHSDAVTYRLKTPALYINSYQQQ